MNDLDVLRDLRSSLPQPTRAKMARGRAGLTAAIRARTGAATTRSAPVIAGRPGSGRAGHAGRFAAVAAVAAAAVAAAAVAVSASGNQQGGHRPPGRATTAGPAGAVLAAKVLRFAAATAGRGHAAEPSPGQWFYRKTLDYQFGRRPVTRAEREWGTFDGRSTAYRQGSKLIVHSSPGAIGGGGRTALDRFDATATPRTAYRALASLPSDPAALLAVVFAHVAGLGSDQVLSPVEQYAPATSGQVVFSYLVELMWDAADGEPPAAQASVYLAMARMPGVSIQNGVTDAAGRPAIGVSDDNGADQLLLDPHSYAVIGIREVSTGVSPAHVASKAHAALPWPPKGAVVESLAIVQLKPVSAPGRR